MYRRILVLLDGSKRAESILPLVEEMAHRCGSTVLLLQVLEPVRASLLNPDPYVDDHIHEAEDEQQCHAMLYLRSRCGELRSHKINARPITARGPVVRSIVETAADQHVDVIAMASHGYVGLDRAVKGSVADGLLHVTDRPILLIRAGE